MTYLKREILWATGYLALSTQSRLCPSLHPSKYDHDMVLASTGKEGRGTIKAWVLDLVTSPDPFLFFS